MSSQAIALAKLPGCVRTAAEINTELARLVRDRHEQGGEENVLDGIARYDFTQAQAEDVAVNIAQYVVGQQDHMYWTTYPKQRWADNEPAEVIEATYAAASWVWNQART